MKTHSTKKREIVRKWHLLDADGETLGKLAVKAATLLMGKHKTTFVPNLDTGDFVIVINASRIKVTGRKASDKLYYRHSGYPGGLKQTKLGDMMQKFPERVIEKAIKGMLPDTSLGRSMYRKLKVYPGKEHPHEAQLKTGIKVEPTKEGN